MSNPQGTDTEQVSNAAEDVHAAADYCRAMGFTPLAVGLDRLADELGYEAPADSADDGTESGAHATA